MKCPALFLHPSDSGTPVLGRSIEPVLARVDSTRTEERVKALPKGVVVRVDALSCNYRDRSLILSGTGAPESGLTPFGSEFAGTVLAVGPGCRLRPGERVMSCSSYPPEPGAGPAGVVTNVASQGVLLLHESQLLEVPELMSTEQAAAFGLCHQTAVAIVRRSGAGRGARVLVTAATSSTSVAIRRILGAHGVETWVQSSKKSIDLLPGEHRWSSAEAADVKSPRSGFTHVLDPFCDLNLPLVLPLMAMGGSYVTCGLLHQHPDMEHPRTTWDPQSLIATLITGNLSVTGNCLGTKEDLLTALELARDRRLPLDHPPIHDRHHASEFLHEAFTSRSRTGKVVLSLAA